MKTIIISLFLLAAGGNVIAADNSAQAWEYRKKMCAFTAKFSAIAYKRREAGLPPEPISEANKEGNPYFDLNAWATSYGEKRATSLDDAISTAAAKCLDNIDSIYRDWQAGIRKDPKTYR